MSSAQSASSPSPSSSPTKRTKRSVTLKDVAKEAGVSLATASFVLSGRRGAQSSGSEATKAKVRAAAKKLGYTPNRFARAMRIGKTQAVLLAVGGMEGEWALALTRAVREAARPKGLSTLILADDTWSDFMCGFATDATFVTDVDGDVETINHLATHAESGAHIVAFSDDLAPNGFDVVSSSAAPAIREAYGMLRSRHSRVHMLTRSVPASTTPDFPSRPHMFINAVRTVGDDTHGLFLAAPGSYEDAYSRYLELMARPDRPTAVIALNVTLARAMMDAAQSRGLRVPDDLEIVLVPEFPVPATSTSVFSTFAVPDVYNRIASVIVNRAVHGSDTPVERHVLEWEFVAGETTVGHTARVPELVFSI